MELYEYQKPDRRRVWWTQRNAKGFCFEIEERGLYTRYFLVKVCDVTSVKCTTFKEALKKLREFEEIYA